MNEIFDVEFDTKMEMQIISKNQEAQQKILNLRSRMIFHKESEYVRLIAKPLLGDNDGKCAHVFVVDNLCSCFE
jgi:hypothetical protein